MISSFINLKYTVYIRKNPQIMMIMERSAARISMSSDSPNPVFGFWNDQVSLVFALLGESPVEFKDGGPWEVISGIDPGPMR